MAGFGAFLTHVFFIYHRKKKRTYMYRRFLILQLFLILLVIIQIIYIYLLHVHYSPQDIFLAADLSTG